MALPPDSSRPIQWGILGAGNIAATVGADIAALAGQRGGRRRRARPRSGGAAGQPAGCRRAYGSYGELVADADVDVVYIATTHAQHHEQALLALRAGKPILVEKAFTLNARQARDVVAEARERRTVLHGSHVDAFQPADPAGGRPSSRRRDRRPDQHSRRSVAPFPFDPRHRLYDLAAGGGALLDLGIYPAHLVWMFLGRPSRVQAIGALSPTGSDATSAQQWGYPGGQFAQLSCTTLAAAR